MVGVGGRGGGYSRRRVLFQRQKWNKWEAITGEMDLQTVSLSASFPAVR